MKPLIHSCQFTIFANSPSAMKRVILASVAVLALWACTKNNPESNSQEAVVPKSEFEALKQEVARLKTQIESITSSDPASIVSVEEFNELKQENEQLKAQIGLFTSGFFEVDGLRFDKNGTLISVAKIENETSQKVGDRTLTTTRTYDDKGRLVQINRSYSGGSSLSSGSPFYWQKVMYEYNGMKCKITTQTSKFGLAAGTPYEEEITETSYW